MIERRTGRRPGIALCSAVAALALLAGACNRGTTESGTGENTDKAQAARQAAGPVVTLASQGTPKTGGKLVYALEAESDGLDPTKNRWALSGIMVAFAVYDPLFAFDPEGKAQPYLAESASADQTYTVWTIKLRGGIKFHNGTPLTSSALKRSLEGFRASALTGPAVRPIQKVDIVDDLTVKVSMSQPWSNFPALLTAQGAAVPAPETLDDPEGSRRPIGTGPFVFKDWVPNDRITFSRNPDYWMKDANGGSLPYLETLVFRPVPDANNRVNALQSGDVNMIHDDHAEQVKLLKDLAQQGRLQYVPDQGEKEEAFVMFNTAKPPLDDPTLRQAIAYATDVKQYMEVAGNDPSLTAISAFETNSPWFADVGFPQFDLEKAKALMAEYRAAKGDAPIEITIGTTTTPENQRLVQLFSEQWGKIGVTAKPEAKEQSTFIIDGLTGKYDAVLWRLFGSPDPDGDYHWWHGANAAPVGELSLNFARIKDAELDRALDAGRSAADPAMRKKAYEDVQRRWAELVPYIWLEHVQWIVAADNTVRGIGNNPLPDAQNQAKNPSALFTTGAHRLTATWLDQ